MSWLSPKDALIIVLYLKKNKCIYPEQEIEFLGLEIKAGQIVIQKHILEKYKFS